MKNTLTFLPLVICFFLLLGYNFMNAQWSAPTQAPPNGNTPAPINLGPDTQAKSGNFMANIVAAATSTWSPRYCDELGANCWDPATGAPGGGGGAFLKLTYTNDVVDDTGVPSSAFCALVAQSDGGCDTGAECSILPENGTWKVNQNNRGDCNAKMYCTYGCVGVPQSFLDSITYSWTASVGSCTAGWAGSCQTTYGTITTTYVCTSSVDGSTVSDSYCTSPKPANSTAPCSNKGTYNSSC